MLPRNRAELLLAEHAAGKPVRVIAKTYGHSPATIRDYVRGLRTPGTPAARTDDFAPFAAYCRQRLTDDPHLRTDALLTEVSGLGLDASKATFYRALQRHGLQPHPCPDCHPARISGYAPLTTPARPRPSPLAMPAAPVAGETLASFLGRLAAVNRTDTNTLLEILPPWFHVKTHWHDDRWQHGQLAPWTQDAADRLAAISGTTTAAIQHALPAFGADAGQPARSVTACHRCTAARGIQHPVPAHLPAHHQMCLRHAIWLSPPGTPQFSVGACPETIAAERQARRLPRRCTTEQLIHAKVQAAHGSTAQTGPAREWKRRTQALIEANPRSVVESCPQALFQAAAYPDTIAAARAIVTSRNSPP
jgi:hypothetical protein